MAFVAKIDSILPGEALNDWESFEMWLSEQDESVYEQFSTIRHDIYGSVIYDPTTYLPPSPDVFEAIVSLNTPVWLSPRIFEECPSGSTQGKALFIGSRGVSLIGVKITADTTYMEMVLAQNTRATLELPTSKKVNNIQMEIDGEMYDIFQPAPQIEDEENRINLLASLLNILNTSDREITAIPDIEYFRSLFELNIFRSDSHLSGKKASNVVHDSKPNNLPSEALAARAAHYESCADLEVVSSDTFKKGDSSYTVNIYGEAKDVINQQQISAIMENVSLQPDLWLLHVGSPIQIQIAEDDVMNILNPGAFAVGQGGYANLVRIKKSGITNPTPTVDLFNTIQHEFCHVINVNSEIWVFNSKTVSQLFVEYERINRSNPDLDHLVAVSPYQIHDTTHFVVEAEVAYFKGEVDPQPSASPILGARSRSELRSKIPELYLALKLILEPESLYFKDGISFTSMSFEKYKKLLDSPFAAEALAPATTPNRIIELINLVS